MPLPDPNQKNPARGVETVVHVKPTVRRKNIIVGEFTYFADKDFEGHVTHHYKFNGDKLIIGKFCQIGAGVNFIMNGANHQMNAVTTFPFFIMDGWHQNSPPPSEMPLKGDTVVENDVWIGENVTILPGVHIGNGAIIGANSTVGSNVASYTIVAGNPAKEIRKRFDDELIDLLQKFEWWNLPVSEIDSLIPILTSSDLNYVKEVLKKKLDERTD